MKKRFKLLSVFLVVCILFSQGGLALAKGTTENHFNYGEYEIDTDYEMDHSWKKTVINNEHPHPGYRTCKCGVTDYYNNAYLSKCSKCYDEWGDFEYLNEGVEHIHSFNSESHNSNHPHKGKRECYCGYIENFDKKYDIECSTCIKNGVSKDPDNEEREDDYYNGSGNGSHKHKRDKESYNAQHPHEIQYICECGFSWYTGKFQKDRDCSECQNGLSGQYTGAHKCTFNYSEEDSGTHPHTIVYSCSCGKQYTTSKLFLEDCVECQKHKHIFTDSKYTEDHPHYIYSECFCGAVEYSGQTKILENCTKCIELKNSHVHDYDGYHYTLEHPHYEFYECSCSERLYYGNKRVIVEGCSDCINESNSHKHSFDNTYCDTLHPHWIYNMCECGVYINRGDKGFLDDCIDCQKFLSEHTHVYNNGYFFDNLHPHWEFYECSCGDREYFTNQRMTVSDCAECIELEKSHTHNFTAQFCYESHPHQNYKVCGCGAYSLLNVYTYFEDCNYCYEENKNQNINHPKVFILNGREVTEEEYYSVGSSDEVYTSPDYLNFDADKDYYSMKESKSPPKIDVRAIAQQIVLGEYAPKVTGLGTAGEVISGVLGVDVWKDVTDMVYYLTHWENNWDHYSKVLVNGVALLPGIGVIKNADELKAATKYIDVYNTVSNKVKKLSKIDIVRLASKSVDSANHAYTKHVGKSVSEMLKLRKVGGSISSFKNSALADEAIYKAVKNKSDKIAQEMASGLRQFAIDYDMGKVIGTGLFNGSTKAESVKRVRVIIHKVNDKDFVIRTAFPIK